MPHIFLLLTSALLLTQCAVPARGRIMLWKEDSIVVVSTEEEFQSAVANVEAGQTLQLNLREVSLTSTLTINVTNVTLRGQESGSTIYCPQEGNALKIHASMNVENVAFVGCRQAAAVRIEPTDCDSLSESTTLFRNVQFRDNKREDGDPKHHYDFDSRRYTNSSGIDIAEGVNLATCNESTVKVKIEDCEFTGNRAQRGGAVFCARCMLNISNSVFSNNSADYYGGSIYVEDNKSSLEVTDSLFENNEVRPEKRLGDYMNGARSHLIDRPYRFMEPLKGNGGAIFATFANPLTIKDSVFRKNQAQGCGGAIFTIYDVYDDSIKTNERTENATISNCIFEENKANYDLKLRRLIAGENYGGAVFIRSFEVERNWTIKNNTFRKNRAWHGGAMVIVLPPKSIVEIRNCIFEENEAIRHGGGLMARVVVSINLINTNFTRNNAEVGGAIVLTNRAQMWLEGAEGGAPCFVRNNSAVNGGGVAVIASEFAWIRNAIFLDNIAEKSGGAMYFAYIESRVFVYDLHCEGNAAFQGGCFAATSVTDFVVNNEFQKQYRKAIKNNTAVAGAGIFIEANHQHKTTLSIRNTLFHRNRAIGRKEFESLFLTEASSVPLTKCGNGGGGGICIVVTNHSQNSVIDLEIRDTEFRDNVAFVGGGMNIQIDQDISNQAAIESRCPTDLSLSQKPCFALRLSDVKFVSNCARFCGGAIHASDPSKIIVDCPYPFEDIDLGSIFSNSLPQDSATLTFANNTLQHSTNSFGLNISSEAFSLDLISPMETITGLKPGSRLSPSCQKCDPDREEGVLLAIKDAFDQTITAGIVDSSFNVSLHSRHIRGQLVYQAVNGIVNINDTIVTGVDQTNEIIIRVVEHPDLMTKLTTTTRACHPEETEVFDQCASLL